jgi:hypothetical protein
MFIWNIVPFKHLVNVFMFSKKQVMVNFLQCVYAKSHWKKQEINRKMILMNDLPNAADV